MWRKTDLHRHTSSDQVWAPITADDFVRTCVADGLDVAAITDHNRIDQVELIVAAAQGSGLDIIRGIEVDTDRGHVILLVPGADTGEVLVDLRARLGIESDNMTRFDELIK